MGLGIDARATQTAVLALVPETEPVVGRHRAGLDPNAAAGVPAHVTVLYPFVPPDRLGPETVTALGTALAGAETFACRFTDVRWFGEDHVWLAPTPAAPFDDLTTRVARAFPQHPPYGGAHDPVPHLTLGSRRHAPLDALRAAAGEVGRALPITSRITRVHLLAGSDAPESWRVVAEIPLVDDTVVDLPRIGAPATRAIVAAGYRRLEHLDGVPRAHLSAVHGVGPKALRVLDEALDARAMALA